MHERGAFSSKTLVKNVFHFQKGLVRPWSGGRYEFWKAFWRYRSSNKAQKIPDLLFARVDWLYWLTMILPHLYFLCKISPCLSWERINPVNGGFFFFGFWYPYVGAFPISAQPPPPNHTLSSSSQSNSNKRQPPPHPLQWQWDWNWNWIRTNKRIPRGRHYFWLLSK